MIKIINLPCIFCGAERITILSKIKLNGVMRKWCSSSCPNCQVKWIRDKTSAGLLNDVEWWSPDKIEVAINLLEKHQNWENATKEFDTVYSTNYHLNSRKTKKGEYRSGLKKKFEYMPELDWNAQAPDQDLVDQVINAMSVEKSRRNRGI